MAQDTVSPNVPGLDPNPPVSGFPRTAASRYLSSMGVASFLAGISPEKAADIIARTYAYDVSAELTAALASGKPVECPAGLYRLDAPVVFPKTTEVDFRGVGEATEFRANVAMQNMFIKDTVANGANQAPVFMDNMFINANRRVQVPVRIGASKGGSFRFHKIKGFITGAAHFGNDVGGSPTAAYYENEIAHILADGDSAFSGSASTMPSYGITFGPGATDNGVYMIVASYVFDVGVDNYAGGNIFDGVHTYGPNSMATGPGYNVRSNTFCQIVNAYADNVRIAGTRIDGEGVIVIGGEYYWAVANTPTLGGAVPIEVATGVNTLSINGGLVRNDNGSNPYIRLLGTRPSRLHAYGMTPARAPVATGENSAHVFERSLAVRAGATGVDAQLISEALASGKAQFVLRQAGIDRYKWGTDGSNRNGSEANENLIWEALSDDGLTPFQMMKYFRGIKQFNWNGSHVMGDAVGKLGFYGNGTPLVKQTVAVAATDASSTQALVNDLRAKLIALGLFS